MNVYEYRTNLDEHTSAKPLEFSDLTRLMMDLRRGSEEYRQPSPPTHDINWGKVVEHGIQMGYDDMAGMWFLSPSEMKRAKKVGAIRPVDGVIPRT